jgi:glycosyltransferase involved in cell wall biosynthesis
MSIKQGLKQGIVIPVYNHGKTAGAVVEKLSSLGLPIIIVDDGSDSETKSYLEKIHAEFPLTVPVVLKKNSGKGGAVLAGLKKAGELGFSHVLQIDADGQHDTGQAAFFLSESAEHPEAAICSYPVYDDSVPSSRKNGRKIANTWAKIVTLSPVIVDSMIGFRVYPVTQVLGVCSRACLDFRMGFDIEVLVRMVWKNIPLMFHPLRVYYPVDGVSHFRPVRDNIGISLVYTKLCCGMLVRWPVLLWRRIKRILPHAHVCTAKPCR